MQRWLFSLAAVGTAAVLAACGGGSGGGSSSPSPYAGQAAPTTAPTAAAGAAQQMVLGAPAWVNPVNALTLYNFGADPVGGTPACNGACATTWPPLVAPPGTQARFALAADAPPASRP